MGKHAQEMQTVMKGIAREQNLRLQLDRERERNQELQVHVAALESKIAEQEAKSMEWKQLKHMKHQALEWKSLERCVGDLEERKRAAEGHLKKIKGKRDSLEADMRGQIEEIKKEFKCD